MKIEDIHYNLPTEPVDERTWNIEEWRKNTPADYFKAIHILNSYDNDLAKALAFDAISIAFRFYCPNVLYKYFSLTGTEASNKRKLQTLADKKIYMSNIKDFNDPFDGKAFFYDPKQLKFIDWLKPHGGKLVDDFTVFIRASSFTANGIQSMPMWAHYGGNHSGYCVSYDLSSNLDLQSCTFPVQYTDDRLDITSIMIKHALLFQEQMNSPSKNKQEDTSSSVASLVYIASLLFNLKHTSWSYEKEFRCTTGATAKGMPYINAAPKEIFIGMNCSAENTEKLIAIAKQLDIPIYRMSFEECNETYELVANEIKY